jgi:hypothetical protein
MAHQISLGLRMGAKKTQTKKDLGYSDDSSVAHEQNESSFASYKEELSDLSEDEEVQVNEKYQLKLAIVEMMGKLN